MRLVMFCNNCFVLKNIADDWNFVYDLFLLLYWEQWVCIYFPFAIIIAFLNIIQLLHTLLLHSSVFEIKWSVSEVWVHLLPLRISYNMIYKSTQFSVCVSSIDCSCNDA